MFMHGSRRSHCFWNIRLDGRNIKDTRPLRVSVGVIPVESEDSNLLNALPLSLSSCCLVSCTRSEAFTCAVGQRGNRFCSAPITLGCSNPQGATTCDPLIDFILERAVYTTLIAQHSTRRTGLYQTSTCRPTHLEGRDFQKERSNCVMVDLRGKHHSCLWRCVGLSLMNLSPFSRDGQLLGVPGVHPGQNSKSSCKSTGPARFGQTRPSWNFATTSAYQSRDRTSEAPRTILLP